MHLVEHLIYANGNDKNGLLKLHAWYRMEGPHTSGRLSIYYFLWPTCLHTFWIRFALSYKLIQPGNIHYEKILWHSEIMPGQSSYEAILLWSKASFADSRNGIVFIKSFTSIPFGGLFVYLEEKLRWLWLGLGCWRAAARGATAGLEAHPVETQSRWLICSRQ